MHWFLLLILIPYIYLITKIYSGLSKIKPFSPDSVPGIFVSVIVACRNEQKNLPFLMSDIAFQDYDPEFFELIVVNDNSSDSTFEFASSFREIKNLKVVNSKGKGKKKAIWTGVEAAAGNIIITTDADCRIGIKWLSTIMSFEAVHKPDMIICPVMLEGGRGFFHRFQEIEFLSLQGITAGSAVLGDPVMCNGAALAFHREEYLKHAGNLHDELVSGDDVFLLHNIKKDSGKTILWLESAEASVTTPASDNLLSFLRQRGRWISKAGAYCDRFTKVLAIVTFVTISAQFLLLLAGLFSVVLLRVFAAYFVLKSIPDFLLLSDTAVRYGKQRLLRWFLPSQLIYPFYVLAIIPFSPAKSEKWTSV
jgi:cellulose synthase/poly-beta-1,6-N-acetylglucosamine synthase-like glycosyltransferase